MTNTIINSQNVNSYDSGNKPYKHDAYRGKWSSIQDFFLSCLVHSFGGKYFSIIPLAMIKYGGILFLIPYVITIFVLTVPIFIIQSFLGQFSTSGFISAFRIAPLFKGLGYTILVLNIVSAAYFSSITSFALVFFFTSFSPQLPWMACNNAWNTPNCTEVIKFSNGTNLYEVIWSSEEYLDYAITWELLLCILIIWILVGVVVLQGIAIIGKILRYFSYIAFGTLIITFVRVLFLPNAYRYIMHFFTRFDRIISPEPWLMSPIIGVLTFGTGWGTILTMASYNNFNVNIKKCAWIIGFSNLALLTISGFTSFILDEYLLDNHNFFINYFRDDNLKFMYAVIPYFFGHINGGNIFSIIFYFGIFLGELSGIIVLVVSILTAIFDEYERFRPYKKEITITLLIFIMLISLGFELSTGIFYIGHIFMVSGIVALFICFIELMIIVWVYGRLRFQRDFQFMVKDSFSITKFYIMRFITPFYLALPLLYQILVTIWDYRQLRIVDSTLIFFFKILPILIFPIYLIYKFKSSYGTFCERFKKLCTPTDWYPADQIERRNYEVIANGSSDVLIEDD